MTSLPLTSRTWVAGPANCRISAVDPDGQDAAVLYGHGLGGRGLGIECHDLAVDEDHVRHRGRLRGRARVERQKSQDEEGDSFTHGAGIL